MPLDPLLYVITIPTTTVGIGTKGGGSTGNGTPPPVPVVSTIPIQVAGLLPMIACDATECRSIPRFCCDRMNVFGQLAPIRPNMPETPVPNSTYENDLNDFLFDLQLQPSSATWTIEKCTSGNTFETIATIINNVYGKYQAIGTIVGHPTYTGFTVNWGRVYYAFGVGVYRIKMSWISRLEKTGCFVSPEFFLRRFNCDQATRTVKFECVMPSLIGHHNNSGYIFDFCGMNWFSSCRYPGFFGTNTVPTYNETFNKYQSGQIEHVHNEAIQKWKYDSLLLTKELHDRAKVYMMMAQSTLVSDYNILNVDWAIKKLSIARAGAYEPVDYNNALPPRSHVSVEFNAGIQNIISSNCCNLK